MFCIQQFNHTNGGCYSGEIIHIVNSEYEDELCKIANFHAKKHAETNNVSNFNNINIVNSDKDISKNGYHLVKTMANGKIVEACLIEKTSIVSRGYIYNTTQTQLNKIYTWKVIPYVFCDVDEVDDMMQKNQVAFKNKKFAYRELEINRFDNNISNASCIGIIGKENIIRTCLVNNMKKICGNNPMFVFTPQEKVTLYESATPDAKISCDITIIKTLLESQLYKTEKSKQADTLPPKITLVLDESIFTNQQSMKDGEIIRELVFNHKCYSINLVILSNGIIDENVRPLLDCIFVCPISNANVKKNIYDTYFKNVIESDIFDKIFDAIGNKSYYTVLDNTIKEHNASSAISAISWYKFNSNDY